MSEVIKKIVDDYRNEAIQAHEEKQKAVDDLLLHIHKRDAYIDRLRNEFKTCVNELCLQCGQYKTEHLGSCDGCRWLKPRQTGGYLDESGGDEE